MPNFLRTTIAPRPWPCRRGGTAAPFTPANDNEVVERLPSTASDPSVRRVDSLRKQLAARPGDVDLRLEIARRYFDLAMAQGDPRYVGYASAAIAPLAQSAPDNAGYWLVRGQIEQYSHDFAGALKSLDKASQLDPQSPEPIAWRGAIHMVQARYPEALSECARLVPLAQPLHAQGLHCLRAGQHRATRPGLRRAWARNWRPGRRPTRGWCCGSRRGWPKWRSACSASPQPRRTSRKRSSRA
jgi:tetratricopeptide (TPR) repeat protein